jgi:hypothetical protein
MATATGTKALCSTCQKTSGTFTCCGCRKDFCYRHVAEHRQELNKQMDEVTTNHDQLQQTIAEQEGQPSCHPLMKKIDEWEQQSVNKIHQAADNARKQLLTILDTYRTQVQNDLAHLTTELNKARNEDDYVETDLKEWTEKLDKLKSDLTATQTIDFNEDIAETSLIPKIFINDASTDIFHQTAGDAKIIEGGRIVMHGPTNEIAAVRCRGEYSSGQHRFRFKIEQLSSNNSFSCGIVSKNTPVGSIFNVPVNCNIYGHPNAWSGTYNRLNHNILFSFSEQNHIFQTNGIYEVLVDCNRKIMCLRNEQSGSKSEINIDVTKCSFPWQFFITLFYANERICLC